MSSYERSKPATINRPRNGPDDRKRRCNEAETSLTEHIVQAERIIQGQLRDKPRAIALGTPPPAWFCAATWPIFAPPLTVEEGHIIRAPGGGKVAPAFFEKNADRSSAFIGRANRKP